MAKYQKSLIFKDGIKGKTVYIKDLPTQTFLCSSLSFFQSVKGGVIFISWLLFTKQCSNCQFICLFVFLPVCLSFPFLAITSLLWTVCPCVFNDLVQPLDIELGVEVLLEVEVVHGVHQVVHRVLQDSIQ